MSCRFQILFDWDLSSYTVCRITCSMFYLMGTSMVVELIICGLHPPANKIKDDLEL
ncbi:unnamed protein product [Arabidopsis halleri]